MNADDSNAIWTVRVILLKRSAKTTKGGRRFSFGALVVIGDTRGRVGLGWGKSGEVAAAIQKGEAAAVAQKVHVPLRCGRIVYDVQGRYCGATVLLKPAPKGTGIIASKPVREVLECAGVKDVVSKSLGARNPANVAKATLEALISLRPKPEKRTLPIVKLSDFGGGKSDPLKLN
jgi:small subunit ribosomal protein S5